MSVASGPLSSGYSQDAIYESPLDYYHASANNSANGAPAELNAEMNSYIPDASQDQSNLMINYIPAGLMEEEMERLFENYGTIEQVKIVRDKMTNVSLCFGFVKYTNNEDAYKAALALNGLPLEGKRMKVSIAKPIGERGIFSYFGLFYVKNLNNIIVCQIRVVISNSFLNICSPKDINSFPNILHKPIRNISNNLMRNHMVNNNNNPILKGNHCHLVYTYLIFLQVLQNQR